MEAVTLVVHEINDEGQTKDIEGNCEGDGGGNCDDNTMARATATESGAAMMMTSYHQRADDIMTRAHAATAADNVIKILTRALSPSDLHLHADARDGGIISCHDAMG